MKWILYVDWQAAALWYLFFIKLVTAVRDALDKTPGKDVNAWERAVTFLNKLGGSLLLGARPK